MLEETIWVLYSHQVSSSSLQMLKISAPLLKEVEVNPAQTDRVVEGPEELIANFDQAALDP